MSLAAATRLLSAAEAEGRDPLVPLWREWRRTLRAFQRQCRNAQRRERQLMERIGFPRVEVPAPEAGMPPIIATEAYEIDRLLGMEPETASLRSRLKRDLAVARSRWEAEARASGLTAATEREAALDRRLEELRTAVAATPARSMEGVVAKLAVAVEWGLSEPEADGHPWTFLHSALTDLTSLAAVSGASEGGATIIK